MTDLGLPGFEIKGFEFLVVVASSGIVTTNLAINAANPA
jgi:hypothetical protein